MSQGHAWIVSVDRRVLDWRELIAALRPLCAGVEGVQLVELDALAIESAPDSGSYRDFTPVAHISHPDSARPLEYVAEVVLDTFGWGVDLRPR